MGNEETKKKAVAAKDEKVAKKIVAKKKDTAKKTVKKITETKVKKKVTDKVEKEVEKVQAAKTAVKKDVKSDTDSLSRSFDITIPHIEIEKSVNEIAEKYSSDIKMSGFRKGKVPADLLKTRYKGALNEEALNKIVEEYVFKKIEADKIRIVSQPKIDKIDHKEGKDLKASFTVEIFPEFEIPELDTIVVEIPSKELKIDKFDEKKQIELILNSRKRAVSVEGKAIKDADIVLFNFQTKILKTKRMTPRMEETVEILKDRDHYIKDIYVELTGKKEGDKFSFEKEYPTDFNKKKWAGEKVEHIIEIIRVQEYFTPVLDADTIKELGFEDEVSLKKKLKEEYDSYSAKQLEEIRNGKRIEKVLDIIKFTIPESLILQEIERIKNDPQAGQFIKDDSVLRKRAEESVKFMLINSEIQKKHKIEASADDVEGELKKMSEQFGMPVKDIRKYYSSSEQKESLKDRIRGDKINDLLKEKIKIKETK